MESVKSADSSGANKPTTSDLKSPFLSVRQVADYLQINTKKVYALVSEGKIPATKVTGKWLFPRKLVDQWLMESSHGGLLTDRLVITGSNDALLLRAATQLVNKMQGHALVSHTHASTELGLSLLARNRADVSGVRWGPREESDQRHPALIQNYAPHKSWVLVRAFERECGLMVAPDFELPLSNRDLFNNDVRWAMRDQELAAQSHLTGLLIREGANPSKIRVAHRALTQPEAASLLARGEADIGPGTRSCATQFGLEFVSLGWEAYDFALNRGIYFRSLFQKLIEELQSPDCVRVATALGGYDFTHLGRIVWSD